MVKIFLFLEKNSVLSGVKHLVLMEKKSSDCKIINIEEIYFSVFKTWQYGIR